MSGLVNPNFVFLVLIKIIFKINIDTFYLHLFKMKE
jgi:hypothetical protein